MRYRIRVFITQDKLAVYYPEYTRCKWYNILTWGDFWHSGKSYEFLSDAKAAIDYWIENGAPGKTKYIKYP